MRVSWSAVVVCLLLGVMVGAFGTVMHRAVAPWGLVLGLAVVVTGGLFARAWSAWPGYVAYAGGWFATVLVLWSRGPGGDLLVPNIGPYGQIWILGGALAAAAAAFAPRSWFVDAP